MRKKRTLCNYRLVVLAIVLFLFAAILKLSYVVLAPTVDGVDIAAFANSRNLVSKTLYASRGDIYDVTGENLAQTVNSYTVVAYLDESRTTDEKNPAHITDAKSAAALLAPILGEEESDLVTTLSKDKYQVEIARNITELTKSKIDALNIPGIGFEDSLTRYYQSGTFASYIIGYAKTDENGEILGELGIEGYFNDVLKGENGVTNYQKDAYGYKISTPQTQEHTIEATSGSDIYLTIDSNIQLIAETAVSKLTKEDESTWSIISVMDATTGAIVASATSPTFNPNDLNTIENYLNPLVSYQYEPGSTMKTFSYAAAIEEGIYDGEELLTSGSIEVADVVISDFNKTGWGEISYDVGYAYSSNVSTTMLGLELGTKTLTDYYEDLGFGSKTGVELYGEVAGTVDFYYQSELANASFGQGISITPIQLMQAYTTLANDGVMLKPYIVDKIVDEKGNVKYTAKTEEVAKVYSASTMEYMSNLMYDAVYNSVSDIWEPSNVTITGKTGTAQIASPSGGYLQGETDVIRSFISVFPQEDPKYIFLIATEKYTGGTTKLAEITTTAIEEIASYAKITDEEANKDINPEITLKNYISTKVSETHKLLENSGLNIITIGTGEYITNQYPLKNYTLFKGDTLFLKTNSDEIIIPNLIGLSLNEVKTYASLANIDIEIEGYGYVSAQSLSEGTVLTEEASLKVVLE